MALNSRRRSGLVHLLHALGRLWSAGVSLDIHKLYEGRPVSPSSLSGEQPKSRRGRVVPNTLPFVEIPAQTLAEVRAALSPQSPRRAAELRDSDATAAAPSASVARSYPFLDRIIAREGDLLVAECDLDLRRHPFLRQHCLCANEVSDLDPDLAALPVVPLSVSMEMLAEVAVASVGAFDPNPLGTGARSQLDHSGGRISNDPVGGRSDPQGGWIGTSERAHWRPRRRDAVRRGLRSVGRRSTRSDPRTCSLLH